LGWWRLLADGWTALLVSSRSKKGEALGAGVGESIKNGSPFGFVAGGDGGKRLETKRNRYRSIKCATEKSDSSLGGLPSGTNYL